MSRKVGFGNQKRGSPRRKLILMFLVLWSIEAIAIALIIRSLMKENMTGVFVGFAFSFIVGTLMIFAIFRHIRGLRNVRDPDREWTTEENVRRD